MESAMSLIGYVRQVRPVQESHVNHLDKVQNLLNENNISMAMNILHNCKTQLTNLVQNIDAKNVYFGDAFKIS